MYVIIIGSICKLVFRALQYWVMRPTLLSTKIGIPRLRADIVERASLIERVKAGLSCPLTLVSAPAGYGKTTLLASLVHKNGSPQRAYRRIV